MILGREMYQFRFTKAVLGSRGKSLERRKCITVKKLILPLVGGQGVVLHNSLTEGDITK